jgi:hypothetical protein
MTRKGQGVSRETGTTIRQIEFELEKAEHGMGLPYDAERVGQLRSCSHQKQTFGVDLLGFVGRSTERLSPFSQGLSRTP